MAQPPNHSFHKPSSSHQPLHGADGASGSSQPQKSHEKSVKKAAKDALPAPHVKEPAKAPVEKKGFFSKLFGSEKGAEKASKEQPKPSAKEASEGSVEDSEQHDMLDMSDQQDQELGQQNSRGGEEERSVSEGSLADQERLANIDIEEAGEGFHIDEDEEGEFHFSKHSQKRGMQGSAARQGAGANDPSKKVDVTAKKVQEHRRESSFQASGKGSAPAAASASPSSLGMHEAHASKSGIAPARTLQKSAHEKEIDALKNEMMKHINDPQFVQFFEMISSLIRRGIKDSKEGRVLKSDPVNNLIESNLARGFLNLAKQTAEHIEAQRRAGNPNCDNQHSLVNILSLFCKKGGQHLKADELKNIEGYYRVSRGLLPSLTKELLPNITPKDEERIQKLIRAEGKDKVNERLLKLFPDMKKATGERLKKINEFKDTCLALNERNSKLNKIFSQLADDVLFLLFPKGFADMKIPLGLGKIAESVYKTYFKADLVNLLQSSYEALEDDGARNNALKTDLQRRLGIPDVEPVVKTPSAFALAFAKDFIQSNPDAVKYTASSLNTLLNPAEPEAAAAGTPSPSEISASVAPSAYSVSAASAASPESSSLAAKQRKEQDNGPMAQLAQFHLANWFVEAAQSMLHTKDPNLAELGQFVEKSFGNLILVVLAKGAKLAVPDAPKGVLGVNLAVPEGMAEEYQFIKVLTDRINEKLEAISGGERIPPEFWKDFMSDLPLPPLLKEVLLPIVIEKSEELQKLSKAKKRHTDEIENFYAEAQQDISELKWKAEWSSISEKMSDLMLGRLVGENIGLISTFQLGDTVNELLAQYLPGVKIDADLQEWLQKSLRALGVSEKDALPEDIATLRHGVQAIILKALANMIKENFKDKSEEYADRLLDKMQHAFDDALNGFGEPERKELEEAFVVQTEIHTKKERIVALEKALAQKPVRSDLSVKQNELLDNVLQVNTRYMRAKQNIDNLKEKLEETITKLNDLYLGGVRRPKLEWSSDDLSYIVQALVPTLEGWSDKVRSIRAKMKTMSPEQLKLLSDAVSIYATCKHAEKEAELFNNEQSAEQEKVDSFVHVGANLEKWGEAKAWMQQTLDKRNEFDQLTKAVATLYKKLDRHLEMFQGLSTKLMKLVGLEFKEDLGLPSFLKNTVWPLIESAKTGLIARELFEQTAPMILVTANLNQNKEELKRRSGGDPFLALLAEGTSTELVDHLSEYVTSYRPFAEQTLILLDVKKPEKSDNKPLDEEKTREWTETVERMEASLRSTIIKLGKQDLQAFMLAPTLTPLLEGSLLQGQEAAVSESLVQWIRAGVEPSSAQIVEMLKKNRAEGPLRDSDEEQLNTIAKSLTNQVDAFLKSRGKNKLTASDLLTAYRELIVPGFGQDWFFGRADQEKLLETEKIVEKIKKVVMTHEEIALALNELIPGAKDLHKLISSQLEAVLTGESDALHKNREFVRRYIEGVMLKRFIKVADANQGQGGVMAVFARKLQGMVLDDADFAGKDPKDVAKNLIDRGFSDLMGIESPDDLDWIPMMMREIGHAKLKEIIYQNLTPMILPMIERSQNKIKLEELSGSPMLGSLSKALSKDLFALLPSTINSYRVLGIELFTYLSDANPKVAPSPAQADLFAGKISAFVKDKKFPITDELLVKAYAEVANVELQAVNRPLLLKKVKESQALSKISSVLATPEEIVAAIGKAVPGLKPEFLQVFTGEIQKTLHNSPEFYEPLTGFVATYAESVLLKVFIRIADAEKNPAQRDAGTGVVLKDSLVVLTEKLLGEAAKIYKGSQNKNPKVISKELNKLIMVELLGVDPSRPLDEQPGSLLDELPVPLRETVFLQVKDLLGGFLLRMHGSLTAVPIREVPAGAPNPQGVVAEGAVQVAVAPQDAAKAAQEASNRASSKRAKETCANLIEENLANMLGSILPNILSEVGGENESVKNVNLISRGIVDYVEYLSRGNKEVATVLLQYAGGEQFQYILRNELKGLAAPESAQGVVAATVLESFGKARAVNLVAGLVLDPLNRVLDNAVQFEEKHGEEFNQTLMANIFNVAADHFSTIKAAKRLAGKPEFSRGNFVAAAGNALHPAVPRTAVEFKKTIEFINRGLRLTNEQKIKWEEKLLAALSGWAREDGAGKTPLTIEDLITKIDALHQEITGVPLDEAQKRSLAAKDAEGFTLRARIRAEYQEPAKQRVEHAYTPAIKATIGLIFPNGKQDLTFVPEELRGQVWKILEQDLSPQVLPMITEILFEPDMINTIVLESLKTAKEELEAPIVVSKKELEDSKHKDLDKASGRLVTEMLDMVTLPDWIKKMIVDKDGKIPEKMQKMIGATLRRQLNGTFMRDKLQVALTTAFKKDKNGEYVLKMKPYIASEPERTARDADLREKVQKEIKGLSREMVGLSISYAIRNKWKEFQHRFDEIIAKAPYGADVKKALDKVFSFIFFKVVGTFLSLLFSWPIKKAKEWIYEYVSLDANREAILSLFTKAPADQPVTARGHVVYNENLIYRVVETIKETVDKALNEPILPAPVVREGDAPGA